jgi:mRNA deadenylase 3'-5' endonuclease subunit Ccr4/uncharacterized protein with PIN domain
MAKHKKKPTKKKKTSKSMNKRSCAVSNNWVDRLDFEPVDPVELVDQPASTEPNLKPVGEESSDTLDIRVITWNVLAQAYLSRRSHRNLPKPYDDVVFNHKKRHALMEKILRKLTTATMELDILCLQEVDLQLVETTLAENHFQGVSTPTTNGGGAGGRVDSCCIYWNRNDWELVNQELICFDDLSTLGSNATKLESNLQGLKQSLLRRNVAIVVRLQHRTTATKIVVSNSHLYWNPEFDYVKLCQAHYCMERTYAFAQGDPIIVCGDLNSQPHGPVHDYLTRGKVNAKEVAPWYNQRREDGVGELIDGEPVENGVDQVTEQLDGLKIKDTASPQIKYMVDFTMNRFSRWLRILGVDCALETEAEEIQRTKHRNCVIFDRCREEGRTLVTTSSKLVIRKDCPPGTYLINPRTYGNPEASLVHLLLSHGVILEPKNFLSRCVVCNGNIRAVVDKEEKKRIFAAHQAPEVSDDLECYECDGCGQGYWWCDRPTSSASRVKGQATRLFELCLRGGVKIKGPLNMFDFLNVDAEREKGLDIGIEMETLEVLEWLKQEELRCPIQLESSYALRDGDGAIVGERQPFTNVTSDFVGLLDYVLFEPTHFELTGRLYVPGCFNTLNKKAQTRNGHFLPSYSWPSDHLAVGAQMSIPIAAATDATALYCGIVKDAVGAQLSIPTVAATDASALYCGVVEDAVGAQLSTPTVDATDTTALYCGVVEDAVGAQLSIPTGAVTDTTALYCGVVEDAVGAQLSIPTGAETDTTALYRGVVEPEALVLPAIHKPKCGCGCVPNILSLFEMHELRKQAKLRKKQELLAARGKT